MIGRILNLNGTSCIIRKGLRTKCVVSLCNMAPALMNYKGQERGFVRNDVTYLTRKLVRNTNGSQWFFFKKPLFDIKSTMTTLICEAKTSKNSPRFCSTHSYLEYSVCFCVEIVSPRPRPSVCRSGSGLSPGVLGSYSIFHYPEFVVFPRVCVLILQPVTYSLVGVTLFGDKVDTVWFFIRGGYQQIPENTSLALKGCKQNGLVDSAFSFLRARIQIALLKHISRAPITTSNLPLLRAVNRS